MTGWIALLGLSSALALDPEVPVLDAQAWRLPVDAQRTLWTDDTSTSPNRYWSAKLATSYVQDPLVYRVLVGSGPEERSVVGDVVTTHLIGFYSLGATRLAMDVPIIPVATSDVAESGGGLGDLSMDVKHSLLNRAQAPVGLALGLRLGLPTATVDVPLGAGGMSFEPSVIADRAIGKALVALNVGYRGNPASELDNLTVDDQLRVRVGSGYALREGTGVSMDVAMGAILGGSESTASLPVEALVGGWFGLDNDLVLRAGVGRGLTTGIGASGFRGVLALAWEPARIADTDRDGLDDPVDSCPDDPEDFDGLYDDDGCPENQAPVRVLILDAYGEVVRGAQVNLRKGGKLQPATTDEEMILEAGLYRMIVNKKGHEVLSVPFTVEPDRPFYVIKTLKSEARIAPVKVLVDRIATASPVQFEEGSAALRKRSDAVLSVVAQTIKAHPEFGVVRVEVHTDSRSGDLAAQNLSEERAEAVIAFLVEQGVAPDRLEAQAKGGSQPVDPSESKEAWARNQRVEFRFTRK